MADGLVEHVIAPRCIAAAGGIFLLLGVIHTWPLATDLGGLSRNDNADTMLNAWAISWVAHQVPRNPARVFDANIFHPYPSTLAYSEPLIVPGLMAIPLRGLGASPVLTYNILLLVGFALTALSLYVLVMRWTGDHLAAILAGALLAYTAHTITRLPQLQAIHAYSLPMAVLAFDRLLSRGWTRDAVGLGVAVLMAALTSGHLAVFLVFGLAAAFLVRPEAWWGAHGRPMVLRLAVAAAATFVVALVFCWPYIELGRDMRFQRPLKGVASLAASGWTYFTTTAVMHYSLWSEHLFRQHSRDALFPGFVALGLAAVALVGGHWRTPRRRMLLAVAAIGFLMSLGTSTPFYEFAYHAFPPMQGIRAASRFGYLLVFAVATLAGLGLAGLRRRGAPGPMRILAVGALVVATLESFHGPLRYQAFDGVSPIYRVIGQDPEPGAVVELPIYGGPTFFRNAPYVLASTAHWRPLVNGYSGHRPNDFERAAERLSGFPGEEALSFLRELDVRYVVLHLDRAREWEPGLAERILQETWNHPSVRLVSQSGEERLYLILTE